MCAIHRIQTPMRYHQISALILLSLIVQRVSVPPTGRSTLSPASAQSFRELWAKLAGSMDVDGEPADRQVEREFEEVDAHLAGWIPGGPLGIQIPDALDEDQLFAQELLAMTSGHASGRGFPCQLAHEITVCSLECKPGKWRQQTLLIAVETRANAQCSLQCLSQVACAAPQALVSR